MFKNAAFWLTIWCCANIFQPSTEKEIRHLLPVFFHDVAVTPPEKETPVFLNDVAVAPPEKVIPEFRIRNSRDDVRPKFLRAFYQLQEPPTSTGGDLGAVVVGRVPLPKLLSGDKPVDIDEKLSRVRYQLQEQQTSAEKEIRIGPGNLLPVFLHGVAVAPPEKETPVFLHGVAVAPPEKVIPVFRIRNSRDDVRPKLLRASYQLQDQPTSAEKVIPVLKKRYSLKRPSLLRSFYQLQDQPTSAEKVTIIPKWRNGSGSAAVIKVPYQLQPSTSEEDVPKFLSGDKPEDIDQKLSRVRYQLQEEPTQTEDLGPQFLLP